MPFFKNLFTYTSTLLVLFALTGCSDKKSDDLTVHWDRDMCSRCVMVISDRHNTVQIIDAQTRKKSVFDDIGCMVVWSKENHIDNKDKIWINDVSSGEWIDARTAFYDADNVTPMGYGFSAHKLQSDISKEKNVLTYDEVLKRISKRER